MIGGQLGVAGTVIGAFLTSVVSATALALYSDSVDRSRRAVRQLRDRTHEGLRGASASRRRSAGARSVRSDPDEPTADEASQDSSRWTASRILRIVLSTVIIGGLALLAIFAVQRALGTELSPGTGTIQRQVSGPDSVPPASDTTPSQDDGTAPGPTPSEGTTTTPDNDSSTAPSEQTGTPNPSPSQGTDQNGDQGDSGTQAPAKDTGSTQGAGSTQGSGSTGGSSGQSSGGGQAGSGAQG